MVKGFGYIGLTVLVLSISGCSGSGENHPLFRKAQYYREQGNSFEAARLLRAYVAANPKSAQGYYALATIYDENLNNPLSAAYCYEECLALETRPDRRRELEALIDRCRTKYIKTLPDGTVADPELVRQLRDENAKLKILNRSASELAVKLTKENRELNAELEAFRPIVEASGIPTRVADGRSLSISGNLIGDINLAELRKPESRFPTEYVVRSGDSLALISQKFYGTIRHYGAIMKANDLKSADRLAVGQKLIIPDLTEK